MNPAKRNASLRRLWGAGDDTVVVLCVSRLASEKNMTLLWRAFDAIAAARHRCAPGAGGRRPAAGAASNRCAGARTSPGVRRGEDLAAHYASADLFVFPSLTETFGNVVPEAMASGLPVVAFDHAAAGQLIRHGDNGWLAAPQEAVQFVDLAARAAADR